MLRCKNTDQAAGVVRAFESLKPDERAELTRELRTTGVDDGWAILLYHLLTLLAMLSTVLILFPITTVKLTRTL